MSPSILISMPVYQRAWILPTWLKYIDAQDYPKDRLGFLFELGPDDDETHDVLYDWQSTHPEYKVFDGQIFARIHHEAHPGECRVWTASKYENMVTLRNNLLERATALSDQFDYYFSLDSDLILEDPQTLNKLVSHIEADPDRHVISPLSYMSPYETIYPSAMTWVDEPPKTNGARVLEKYEIGKVFKADIVMAAVFMRKEVFTTVRYRLHRQGEDLGFAQALNDAGFNSYAVWDIYLPHLMYETMLKEYIQYGYDPRNGQIYTS